MKKQPSETACQILNQIKVDEFRPKQRLEALSMVCGILSMDSAAGPAAELPAAAPVDFRKPDLEEHVKNFIAERCVKGQGREEGATDLWKAFLAYLEDTAAAIPRPTQKAFGQAAGEHFNRFSRSGLKFYAGVSLKDGDRQGSLF